MKTRKQIPVVAALFAAFTLISNLHGQPLVNIETVTVGDPGNAPEPMTGDGAVTNVFAIGKYEVTIGQYTAFLNAVASSDPHELYNEWDMASNLNVAGIARHGSPSAYTYSIITNSGSSANRPITYVSWFDAARFCNWLHNGATNGADTEDGAYTLMGARTGRAPAKNPDAKWWLPTESEAFKAAYYKGGSTNAGYWLYATQSDNAPGNSVGNLANQANYFANDYAVTQTWLYSSTQNYLTDVGAFGSSPSAYGTYDQSGSVLEWTDPDGGIVTDGRLIRGGSWDNDDASRLTGYGFDNGSEWRILGFRVARASTNSPPPPLPQTNAILTLQRAGSLTGSWQSIPLGPEMITPDGKLNMGRLTNGASFYRMKIEAVVQ